MNLTEGQLFTIEALNKVEGFVWPQAAEFAAFDSEDKYIGFYSDKPKLYDVVFSGNYMLGLGLPAAESRHPDWRNSLITREQFYSVDRWVRNDGSEPVINGDFDLLLGDGEEISFSDISVDGWDWSLPCEDGAPITHWRYHKPTKETEMQPEAPKQPSIDEIYSQYKTQRGIVESAKKTLADEMEAEDKLLEQIKAWNLEYGFDVRLLGESEEKPELVITDWRDLRDGDVIWWSGDGSNLGGEYKVKETELSSYKGTLSIAVETTSGVAAWIDVKREEWRFIRRP